MPKINCDNCRKLISKTPSAMRDHNFCNRQCFGEWHSKQLLESHPRSYLTDISCEQCGNMFRPKEGKTRFCSTICFDDSRRELVDLRCDNCGGKFTRDACSVRWSEERGSTHFFCGNPCSRGFHKKENHPRWISDRSKLKRPNKSLRETEEMRGWRRQVYTRDDWTCQMCGGRSSAGHAVCLNAHHIKRLVDHPELGCDLDNGITLCEDCHKTTYQKEEQFESQFNEIVQRHLHQCNEERVDQTC